MREVHVSHVSPSFWYRIELGPIPSKFLVPEKSGTRTHDTRSKFRGRLPLFIEGFLSDRQFQVRLSAYYSQLFDQEMGAPQGSILSVTLFGLKINSIVKAISPGVEC